MATTVEVEARVLGRRTATLRRHPLVVPTDDAGGLTLAAVIEAVVRSEVRAFEERRERNTFLHVFTQAEIDEAASAGRISSGEAEAAPAVDADDAVAAALAAHRDGLFQVIVDDEPVDALDAVVGLHPGSHLLFLRLVALTGG